jgi:high-affinity Fe2+/Pb2+ permease
MVCHEVKKKHKKENGLIAGTVVALAILITIVVKIVVLVLTQSQMFLVMSVAVREDGFNHILSH